MNVTQRKYTLDRLNTQLSTKINAIIAENDAAVIQNNKDFLITFEQCQQVILSNPEVVSLRKSLNSSSLQAHYVIDDKAIRIILNKPLVWLRVSTNSYVDDSAIRLQQEIVINGDRKCLINAYAERIKKVQARAQYAKDQVMLGDSKEALAALEEFNSLVF
jgi:hypothetical protein